MRIENAEGITKILMRPRAHCLCDIGNDWYTIQFTAIINPGNYYPDYMDVLTWINKNIEGKRLNIETAVSLLWNYLTEYDCKPIVKAEVSDASTHFPVVVWKEK